MAGHVWIALVGLHPRVLRRVGVDRARFVEQPVPLQVTSVFGRRDVGQQVLSICSFLTWAGTPVRWLAVSDGTVPERDLQLVRDLHACVEVRELDEVLAERDDVPSAIAGWAARAFHGRKLALITGIGRAAPPTELFLDSDVLLLPGAPGFVEWLADETNRPAFLADYRPAFDRRLLHEDDGDLEPPWLNGGLLVADAPLDWTEADRRLAAIDPVGERRPGTEQTCTHLTARAAGATPLPTDLAVLTVEDQGARRDVALEGERTWLRHYVSGQRRKLWRAAARERFWLRLPRLPGRHG